MQYENGQTNSYFLLDWDLDVTNTSYSRTGRDEKKEKTQEKMERGSRKRLSSAGSEEMERVGGR